MCWLVLSPKFWVELFLWEPYSTHGLFLECQVINQMLHLFYYSILYSEGCQLLLCVHLKMSLDFKNNLWGEEQMRLERPYKCSSLGWSIAGLRPSNVLTTVYFCGQFSALICTGLNVLTDGWFWFFFPLLFLSVCTIVTSSFHWHCRIFAFGTFLL